MKLKHVGMIVVSVLAMSSAAVSAAEGDESVTTTVNGGVIHFKGGLSLPHRFFPCKVKKRIRCG
ncbi:hypothetical protein FAU36_004127 [Escherichia coli]|nr:hypothetical protein [Escherichia coli]EFL6775849.1 hypothetical protein [Escherichia coli]